MRGTAVVFEDQDRVSVRGVEVPNPTPRDVVIDVEYSWISIGTESSFLRGERISGEQPYQKGDRWPFPNVAGYQKVGIVREVGKEVTGFKAGDRVFASVSKVSGMVLTMGGMYHLLLPRLSRYGGYQRIQLPKTSPVQCLRKLVTTAVCVPRLNLVKQQWLSAMDW